MDSPLLRILILIVGLVLGISLMGCTGQDLSASPKGDGSAASIPTASFAQFNDIPVPSGATMNLERSLLLGASEEWTGSLVYTSGTDTARVFDLYKAEMPKFGWTELTVIRGERSIMSYQRGNRVATIEIQGRTIYGTRVSVTVSPNAAGGATGYGAQSYGGLSSSSSVSRTPLR